MKIGINYGCANGGMMDSMTMTPIDGRDPGWKPPYIVEVTEAEWEEWQVHLRAHGRWEEFWDNKCIDAERYPRGLIGR